jgi:hypothetical protein
MRRRSNCCCYCFCCDDDWSWMRIDCACESVRASARSLCWMSCAECVCPARILQASVIVNASDDDGARRSNGEHALTVNRRNGASSC